MLFLILGVVAVVQLAILINLAHRQHRATAELVELLKGQLPDELTEQREDLQEQNRLYREFLTEDRTRAELAPKERFAVFATWKQTRA